MGIVTVAVTVTDFAVGPVNDDFAFLVDRDVTGVLDSFRLGFVVGSAPGVSSAAYRPLVSVGDDVLVLTSHD